MTMTSAMPLETVVLGRFRRLRLFSLAAPVLVLAYLIYTAFAFDLAGVAGRAKLDNAQILLNDFWSHKIHVTRDNRAETISVSVEGEPKGLYLDGKRPAWVSGTDDQLSIDLHNGHSVRYFPNGAEYLLPEHGVLRITSENGKLSLERPATLPEDLRISASDARISITTPEGRLNYTRSKVETLRYQAGWPLFFFTPDSAFFDRGWGELAVLATVGPRLDPETSNISAMTRDFLQNPMWRHADVFWALFETLLMAFLGTFIAAIVALPLAFMAARNMLPFAPLRFAMRRIFDFIRGVDGLIWTIVLARAFGPGPMTGAIAMALTDTGSFGKIFSEALENIDEKQVEGIRSTGANSLQRARFGVLPQVMPVLLSQVLYYFESNTRSATVIGAIVGGGIGLLLTQAMQTQRDWEDVAYYILLIILMVMAMDSLSGWLRRKLIKG